MNIPMNVDVLVMVSPVLTGLMGDGLGYLLGSNFNQQATAQVPANGTDAHFERRRRQPYAVQAARRVIRLGHAD